MHGTECVILLSMPKLLHRQTILNIRSQYEAGYIIKEIAKMHGLNRDTVSRIVTCKTYKHVKDVPHARPPIDEDQRRHEIDRVARSRRI